MPLKFCRAQGTVSRKAGELKKKSMFKEKVLGMQKIFLSALFLFSAVVNETFS